MKIAIPVNENKSETSICVSFGRAPYFMLHDVEGKTTKYIANTAAEAQGGAILPRLTILRFARCSVIYLMNLVTLQQE